MFISSSGMPQLVKCKISGRYVPISPSYDPNEFVHFYNKKSHQKIMTFITNCLSLFFRSLVFFFKKLRNQSTLSTIPKRKFKNSLIQPRTSRSNFGKMSSKIQWNSMKFIKILARPLWLDFEGALKKNLINVTEKPCIIWIENLWQIQLITFNKFDRKPSGSTVNPVSI